MTPDPHHAEPETPLSKERLRRWLKPLKASHLIEDKLRRKLQHGFTDMALRLDHSTSSPKERA